MSPTLLFSITMGLIALLILGSAVAAYLPEISEWWEKIWNNVEDNDI